MTNPTSTQDLQSELGQMWRSRPVRTPDDSKIAGVCGGIGRRYGIDPVLPRILFVVTALWGGSGIALYALAWLLFRSPGDEVSMGEALVGRGRSSGSKVLAVLLVIVTIAAAPTFGGAGETLFLGTGLILAAGMLLAWYGLHRRTPTPPLGWASMATTPYVVPGHAPGSGPAAYPGAQAPPSWDPLGATPFAWDLPEPGEPQTPAPRHRSSRLTLITLGLALVTAGVAAGFAHFGQVGWLTAPRVGALALAVVGAGLLVGSVTRRGHGLLSVAGPLAGFVVLGSLVGPGDLQMDFGKGASPRDVVITEPSQIDDIRTDMGAVTVDMARLTLDHDRSMSIRTDMGRVSVRLPHGTDVRVDCSSDRGKVDCPTGLDVGDDGPGGPQLRLDVHSDLGAIEVTR